MESDANHNSATAITVFFPCYNEQENVSRTVDKAVKVLEQLQADYEIIVVDDGSADKTGEISDQLAAQNPRVKVVHHPVNRGYGAALRSGIAAATKPLIFYTDGDGQFDIAEMSQLLPMIDSCDIVSCYRLDRKDPLHRKLFGFCWTTLINTLFHMRVRDIDCAFKLYRKKIFCEMQLQSTGALIDTEILARAIRRGCKIQQVGVHHYPRQAGAPTGGNPAVVLRAFKELFKLYRQIKANP